MGTCASTPVDSSPALHEQASAAPTNAPVQNKTSKKSAVKKHDSQPAAQQPQKHSPPPSEEASSRPAAPSAESEKLEADVQSNGKPADPSQVHAHVEQEAPRRKAAQSRPKHRHPQTTTTAGRTPKAPHRKLATPSSAYSAETGSMSDSGSAHNSNVGTPKNVGPPPSAPRVSMEVERERILRYERAAQLRKNRRVGQRFCLIDMRWWRMWSSHVGYVFAKRRKIISENKKRQERSGNRTSEGTRAPSRRDRRSGATKRSKSAKRGFGRSLSGLTPSRSKRRTGRRPSRGRIARETDEVASDDERQHDRPSHRRGGSGEGEGEGSGSSPASSVSMTSPRRLRPRGGEGEGENSAPSQPQRTSRPRRLAPPRGAGVPDPSDISDSGFTTGNESDGGTYSQLDEVAPRPGPLDNSSLLADDEDDDENDPSGGANGENIRLRTDLVRDADFVIVSEAAFDALQGWYGGGPKILRSVIARGVKQDLIVEIYPLRIRVARLGSNPKKMPEPSAWANVETIHKSKDYDDDEVHERQQRHRTRLYKRKSRKQRPTPSRKGRNSSRSTSRGPAGRRSGSDSNDHSVASNSEAPAAGAPGDLVKSPSTELVQSMRIRPMVVSRNITLQEMKSLICRTLRLPESSARLWEVAENGDDYAPLSDLALTAEAANIIDNQVVLVEERDGKSDSWRVSKWIQRESTKKKEEAAQALSVALAHSGGGSTKYEGILHALDTSRGLTGLRNLGNTCFLNAAVQCLVHTSPFVDTFLSGSYKTDLNRDNPLGMKGQLADEFYRLAASIWATRSRAITPKQFLRVIGKYAPRFMSNQQQDAQELLAFLLDGLHEDVNRVKEKEYVEELDEPETRPHEHLAAEAWERHLRRNDSMVVDMFHGQFRSIVECPKCHKESIKFDPFAYVSLPIPAENVRTLVVCFVPADGALPRKLYKLELKKRGKVLHLKTALSKACGVPSRNLVVAEVYQSRIYRYLMNKDRLTSIRKRDDIHVFEVLRFETLPEAGPDDAEESAADEHSSDDGGEDGGEGGKKSKKKSRRRKKKKKKKKAINRAVYITVFCQMASNRGKFATPVLLSLDGGKPTFRELYMGLVDKMHSYLHAAATGKRPRLTGVSFNPAGLDQDAVAQLHPRTLEILGQPVHPMFGIFRAEESERVPVVDQGTEERILCGQMNDPQVDLTLGHPVATIWENAQFRDHFDLEAEAIVEPYEEHRRPQELNLAKCLELFIKPETLGKRDQWYCNACRDFRAATKHINLWKLPDILTIHLKRFAYEKSYDYREKLTSYVDFPLNNLSLDKFVEGPLLQLDDIEVPNNYELFAVINHFGAAGGGHYTAFIKSPNQTQWLEFDDDIVTPLDEANVATRNAYVLFYRRVMPLVPTRKAAAARAMPGSVSATPSHSVS